MPDIEPRDDDREDGAEPGARPIWSGTVTFGLVSVPVNIYSAHRPKRISLHMVTEDGTPLARRYFRADSDRQLDADDIVRGYEVKKGTFVTIEDDELERLAPEKTRDIDLRAFVPVEQIDPIYFERAYYLAPVGSNKAYKLLARVMEEAGRAGVATFVMREKEYLAAVLSENGILRLETLRFADEIRTAAQVGLPKPVKPRPADVRKIEAAIERLTRTALSTKELEDESAERLADLARRKARKGDDVVKVELPEEESQVVDLVERLRESLKKGDRARAG